uniref:Uncharacterized protein n=1 Tax=Acrobeloides nanus TaxID=290746 RepID=A0A914EN96_9BILA
MFHAVIRTCAKQFSRPVFVRYVSNQGPRFISDGTAPTSADNSQSNRLRYKSSTHDSNSVERKYQEICPSETVIFGRKRIFLNLHANKESKIVIFVLTQLIRNKKESMFLAPNQAKQLLEKLKEAKKLLDEGNIKSDGSECAYNSSFLSKKPFKDGEKNMEYSVQLKIKSAHHRFTHFFVVAHNLDDDLKNVISVGEDGIDYFIATLDKFLKFYEKYKLTETAKR